MQKGWENIIVDILGKCIDTEICAALIAAKIGLSSSDIYTEQLILYFMNCCEVKSCLTSKTYFNT